MFILLLLYQLLSLTQANQNLKAVPRAQDLVLMACSLRGGAGESFQQAHASNQDNNFICPMFYVIVEKEAGLDPEQPHLSLESHPSLELLNEELFSQAVKVKQRIRNRSAGNRHAPKLAREEGEQLRLATAYTADPSHLSSLQPEFTHPWALTPKARSVRTKIETDRRNSLRSLSQPEGEMFGRITIHCLRAKRESLEQRAALLDSHCDYTLRKLERLRGKGAKEKQQARRLLQLRREEKEETQVLTHPIQISQHLSEEERSSREKLRQQVLSQRTAKQRVLEGVQKEKARAAYQQRLSSYHLTCEKKELQNYEIYEKRLICQKEKQTETLNQRIRAQRLEAKRQSAKAGFRNKWMSQFQLASKAERTLTEKEHLFASKMQRAIQAFADLASSR